MQVARLIEDLWDNERDATDAEIRRLRVHVARAGFDPDARERVRGRGAGVVWRGSVLRGGDMLPPAEAHYVRHVLSRPEWPEGTTLDAYLQSIREIVEDDASGVVLSRCQGQRQVGFIGRSRRWRGPRGQEWILVDYREVRRHIVTAYQVSLGDLLSQQQRDNIRWLKRPS